MITQKTKREAMEAVRKKYGRLTARLFWKEARAKSGVAYSCHDYFTWNVKKAAEAHWDDQARTLFASVIVKIETKTHIIKSVGYVRDPDLKANEPGYVPVAVLRDDKAWAARALYAETERIKALLERAREFAEAVGLEEYLEKAIRSVLELHGRCRTGTPGGEYLEAAE